MYSMEELKVHRFSDCNGYPSNAGLKLRHRLSSMDLSRITCEECKQRILAAVAKRSWAKLATIELEALEITAAEVEAGA